MKFRLIAMTFVLMVTAAHSDWKPTCISTTLFLPLDPQFDELKSSVCSYLSTSWVTQEKAHCIMDLIVLTQPKVCVDIGTFTGSSALPMAVALRYLGSGKVYLIDAWSNLEAVKHISSKDPNYNWWSTLNMKDIKRQCLTMIREWSLESYCQVIHAPSEQAIHQIDQIDFLHLDGNFSTEGSLLDATLYLPKVRSGGYILLSNAFMTIDHALTKKATMWFLYYECELIIKIENSNAMLFRKQ
jgi:hypothetical protein